MVRVAARGSPSSWNAATARSSTSTASSSLPSCNAIWPTQREQVRVARAVLGERERPPEMRGRRLRIERDVALGGKSRVAQRGGPQVVRGARAVRPKIEGRARVVGQDVDDVRHAITRGVLDPARHGVVLLGAVAPGQLRVGAVAHEHVREAELGLAGQRRARHERHEVPAGEALEHLQHLLDRTASHGGQRAGPERAAHHRRIAEHAALGGGKDVQTGGDQGLCRSGTTSVSPAAMRRIPPSWTSASRSISNRTNSPA